MVPRSDIPTPLKPSRAQPRATHRQVAIQPDALVICPIAMAGEDTAVHAVAVAVRGLGQPPTFWTVPDPRYCDDQFRLLARVNAGRMQMWSEEFPSP